MSAEVNFGTPRNALIHFEYALTNLYQHDGGPDSLAAKCRRRLLELSVQNEAVHLSHPLFYFILFP